MMAERLLLQFALSTLMVVACVIIHGVGLFSVDRVAKREHTAELLEQIRPLSHHGALFVLGTVFAIIVLHGVEIWLFALLYIAVGAVPHLEGALYASTISYSTVGYSDATVLEEWRLLAAFESILGIILLGWSTSFFFRMIGRLETH